MLIEDIDLLDVIGAPGMIAFLSNRCFNSDGIANEYRANETQSIIPIRHCERIDCTGCHTDGNAENERPVRDTLSEILRFAPSAALQTPDVLSAGSSRALRRTSNPPPLTARSSRQLTGRQM